MKHPRLLATAAALFALFAGPALAQVTGTKNVDVSVTFTAKCQLATGSTGALAVAFGAYQAFDPNVVFPGTAITLECTRGLGATPAIAWDGAAANNSDGVFGGATATTNGTVAGLRYALTAAPGSVTAGAAPVLTSGSPTNGTPATYPFTIGGTLFSGSGSGASGAQTDNRVLTVTF
jgi:hypothetical protein